MKRVALAAQITCRTALLSSTTSEELDGRWGNAHRFFAADPKPSTLALAMLVAVTFAARRVPSPPF